MRQSHKASTRRPPVRGTHAESTEARRRRSTTILSRLRRSHFPTSTALHHSSPLDLLIATILSAQCTDERVNIVTESLFKKYATAADYAAADVRELEAAIRSTGFFRAKAKNIINCCRALVDRHGGRVPESLEELVQLSGVGRKTANVVLGSVFRKTVGVVVDTHVKRVALRLGLTEETDPGKVELDLMGLIPKKNWIEVGNLFIWHGRKVCDARKPRCSLCPLADLCPSAELFTQPLTSK